jgi:serine phosphatase RsbU (regulator of sigma subunit)
LEVTKQHFNAVFGASPEVARSILNTLINIVRETDRRAISDLEARNVELAQAYADLEAAQADRITKAALEAQMEVAARAQRSLLPRQLPDVAGFQFAAQFEPARHIGGDFYDVRQLEDGRVSVVLADVSDKGAHAALFMAVARTLFLTEEEHHENPLDVVMAVHRGLIQASTYDMFVTAIYGVLDPAARTFRYVRAGHDEPLYVRPDGSATFLGGRGRFLGLWLDMPPTFEEQQVTLDAGDCLVIYSDGVTDMRDPSGDSFGRERMRDLVKSIHFQDAERIARSIYNAVQQHRTGSEAFDDFTLVVLRAE